MQKDSVTCSPSSPAPSTSSPLTSEPMEVEPATAKAESPVIENTTAKPETPSATPAATSTTTKKKKKASYKDLMSGMMNSSGSRDVQKEKESLRKVTGGGQFSKIDKI